MPRPDYLPRRDLEFLAWVANFTGRVISDPPAYGISPADAAGLQMLAEDFAAVLAATNNPITRTAPIVAAKNAARAALVARIRQLARIIRAHPPVGDAARIDLGLTPVSATPPPSGRPHSRPLLSAKTLADNRVRLRLSDDAATMRRGKPPGTVGAVLLMKIGGPPPEGCEGCAYAGIITTALHTLILPPAAARQDVWLTARWFNLRGEEGPAAAPVRAFGTARA